MPQPQYKQGDLVYLFDPIKIPKGEPLEHPVLIISSNTSNSYENFYTGVMMSSTNYKDRYSFDCTNEMFESPIKLGSQIRLYITASFKETEIKNFTNRIKPIHLKALLIQIKELIFSTD